MSTPTYPTLGEALAASFGESATKLEGHAEVVAFFRHRDGQPGGPGIWTGAQIILNSDSTPFVSCGTGEVLAGFHRTDDVRGTVYLVRDSSERDRWMWSRAREEQVTFPAPSPRYRLAISL